MRNDKSGQEMLTFKESARFDCCSLFFPKFGWVGGFVGVGYIGYEITFYLYGFLVGFPNIDSNYEFANIFIW